MLNVFSIQDKSAPLHIRRAFYDAHAEMDHTTTKLQSAAEDLKKCLENVLHEDHLRQHAPSMTDTHYQSLKEPFLGIFGRRDSAVLHWLQVSWNSVNPDQGGNKLLWVTEGFVFSLFRTCSTTLPEEQIVK